MISKSGQSAKLPSCYDDFDPDWSDRPAIAVRLDFSDYEAEVPQHQHREGQLILALHGAVTCRTENGIWIVPPDCGIWIPGGVPHSNQVTSNARLSYLFVQPEAASLPRECCTLSVSPMLREMILRLADVPVNSLRTIMSAAWCGSCWMNSRKCRYRGWTCPRPAIPRSPRSLPP